MQCRRRNSAGCGWSFASPAMRSRCWTFRTWMSRAEARLAGPSGSGKTTLLNIIAGILVPTQAAVLVDGADVGSLPTAARDEFPAQRIGQIFQTFNLIPALSR